MKITEEQAGWRTRFERTHRFGIPLYAQPTAVQTNRRTTMARTMKLPTRSTAKTFDPAEVLDVRLSLLNPDLPKGEGVVIADPTDTAPKSRVLTRNMVPPLAEVQEAAFEDIPAEFYLYEDESDDAEPYLPEWIEEYRDEAEEEGGDAPDTFTFPAITARQHTVEDSGQFYPLVSRKPGT